MSGPETLTPKQETLVNITIDGKPYRMRPGMTIIEVLDEISVAIPRYCYHPGLSIAGNCRICQVEIEKMPKTAIACNTRIAEGMVIHTKSPKAEASQKAVLEFILANHPLDCPVCDQAGECKLQDYYMEYGAYDPHFNENKVKKTKKAFPIGPHIMLDQERCILCSRCVRFTDEITRTHEFGIFNRGDHAEVDVYKELNNPYSGNVADICPVGALTDRDFRFKLRVWYLDSKPSVCPGCSRGCNISVQFEKTRPYHLKDERVMRLKPRENPLVNQWWMCDEGRYAYKQIDEMRLKKVMLKGSHAPRETDWESALAQTVGKLSESKAAPDKWALVLKPVYTNEEFYLIKKLFRDTLKWKHIYFASASDEGVEDSLLMKKDKNPNTQGALRILGVSQVDADIARFWSQVKAGAVEHCFVMGRDLAKSAGYSEDGMRLLKLVIYEGAHLHQTSQHADWVLPSAVYAEKDGTFTNFESRVQRVRKVLNPMPDSRPTWRILSDLLSRLGVFGDYLNPSEIFNELAKNHKSFAGLTYESLEPYGKILNA